MTAELVPPVPAILEHRPTVGGLVAPWVNVTLHDGGVDFRSAHHARFEECWTRGLCQTCGKRLSRPAVLFGGPNQLAGGRFDEPPLHPACAVYASKACPMVAGRMDHYADRDAVSEGNRGKTCTVPGCDCGGWRPSDDKAVTRAGDRAHPWYALYLDPAGYAVTVNEVETRCPDLGCAHKRLLVNGGILTAPPLKVVLVSDPDEGRVWRRIPDDEATALLPASYSPDGAVVA